MVDNLSAWLSNNILILTLALLCAVIILVVLLITLYLQVRRFGRKHQSLMTGLEGKNLEEMLAWYLEKVGAAEQKVTQLNDICLKLDAYAQKSLQEIALVRFNAFADMGGDLSFAAALLDLHGDGLIISSINSREESRVYAKPVVNGTSTYHLSNEEKEAINLAMQSKIKQPK